MLMKKLKEVREDDASAKSLVFSHFQSSIEFLKIKLTEAGYNYRTLSGGMSRAQRTKALEDFQNDPPTTIFLMSIRSGACGINLTQANNVFMLEPSLNPALEAQAIGRVHRMGQKRVVKIFKLVMKGSVEEQILKVVEDKQNGSNRYDAQDDGSGAAAAAAAAASTSKAERREQRKKARMASGWGAAAQKHDERLGQAGAITLDRASALKLDELEVLFSLPKPGKAAGKD